MKRLILIVLMAMVMSGTAIAFPLTDRVIRTGYYQPHIYGSSSGYYYGSSSGYYGNNGYYGDSDAGKMIAAGQLILDISHAVGSYESTHRTLGMGERAQEAEYQNRSCVQQQLQTQIVQKTDTDSENQKLQDKINELEEKNKALKERKELQKKLAELEEEIAKLEKIPDADSTGQNL